MSEKIPQHRHCATCNRAFVGEGRHCSPECGTTSAANLKKRKRQLLFLYAISVVMLIIALVIVNS
jgi:predicted nucleic acid-binding Zn ribbon protein